jgi:hypothetical protein
MVWLNGVQILVGGPACPPIFELFIVFQHALDQNECFFMDNIEKYVEDSLPSLLTKDPLEACLTHFSFEEEVNDLLDIAPRADFHQWRIPKESLPLTSSTPPVPSLKGLNQSLS